MTFSRALFHTLTIVCSLVSLSAAHAEKPNFVIIFADDQGYQDLGCFGSPDIKTPHIDRMAKEGMKFTSFYAQTVCGPSRAALMTGCYPLRVAQFQNRVEVHPRLHSKEITIAEILKSKGYATAAYGKWDLAGHTQSAYTPNLLPTHQGFDEFFGTPTSNDSIVNLLRDDEVIEKKTDMSLLTQRYSDEAIDFIKRNQDKPFFVYLAHTMPHVKLAASEKFRGTSERGLYGDVIEELDANVGRILDTIKQAGLSENTYVIYTSDNGPWYLGRSPAHLRRIGKHAAEHGGSAIPLRGAKTSMWEGGLRVPCVVWGPGRVPAGTTCDKLASTLDLLPTLARLAGGDIPNDRVIDGHDISDLIHGVPGSKSPTKAYYYYARTKLRAIRWGKWKLHLPAEEDPRWKHYSLAKDSMVIREPLLFDLDADLSETTNVADKHPEVVTKLLSLAEWAREDIGDVDRIGENARFYDPQPRRPDIKQAK